MKFNFKTIQENCADERYVTIELKFDSEENAFAE